MSIVTTTTLKALWREANSATGGEAEAVAFWQHYLSKFAFREEQWICDAEVRPEPGSRRRVDRGIRYVQPNGEIIVLCWLEAKGDSSRAKLKEAEAQALDACKTSLRSHNWQNHIYALTTGKTMAKAWSYEKGSQELLALYEEEYIEANSTDGKQIAAWFDRMKSFLPSAIADHPGMTRMTDSSTHRHGNPILPKETHGPLTHRHANPIFPRENQAPSTRQDSNPPASKEGRPPSASDIKSQYRRVRRAKRDKQNLNALLVDGKSIEGWKPHGSGEEMILYCPGPGLYIYKNDIF